MKKIFIAVFAATIMMFSGVSADEKNTPQPIGVFATLTVNHTEKDGDKTLLRQRWTQIRLLDGASERFPALNDAVTEFYNGESKLAREWCANQKEIARKDAKERPEYFAGYFSANDIIINRADDTAFSFLELPASYTGGAHGMYGKFGQNLDTATGKKVELSDVFNDIDQTAAVVVERIFAQYGDEMLYEPKEKITELIKTGRIVWTLDNDGVTFYFNPYEIAAYAAGILHAKVFFDFDKTLFKLKYSSSAKQFVTNFEGELSATINGKITPLSAEAYDGTCRVTAGAEEFTADGKYSDAFSMFIKQDKNKYFLWIDAKNDETEVREILVFALAPTLKYVGTLKHTFVDPESNEFEQRRLWMTNPDGFMIYKNVTRTGEDKTDIGSVGENGLLMYG